MPPELTPEERAAIETGAWFSRLSQALRDDILSRAHVRRYADGSLVASRGAPAEEWCAVARGAMRVSSVSLSGKQVTLTYVEPGVWFGDIALVDGLPRTHDANAHGDTTLLIVRKADFRRLLADHVELYDALLQLNCRRLRVMFDTIEDLNTRPLAGRLAKQLLLLARRYGVRRRATTIRIGLQLAQEDLAQLLGASRQRVNQELKAFERAGAVRVEPTRLVVRVARQADGDRRALRRAPTGRHSRLRRPRRACRTVQTPSDPISPFFSALESSHGNLHRHQARRRTACLRHRRARALPVQPDAKTSPARCRSSSSRAGSRTRPSS